MKIIVLFLFIGFITLATSCNKDVKSFNDIHFSFQFDASQIRLDNFGEPSEIPAGNAAQTPVMNLMSVHYIELAQTENTLFKEGAILYYAPETESGGETAIDFDSSNVSTENVDFVKINLDRLPPGTYNYIRASVAYQNYAIQFNLLNIPGYGNLYNQTGTIASFIGYRTYIRDLTVSNLTIPIFANKEQGFWGFETDFSDELDPYNTIVTGQAPAGATTVVNPIAGTSPVPPGSCVVTGKFVEPLIVTGDETTELYIYMSFSINQSFEWIDTNNNGKWDIDATNSDFTEVIVDMGLRGMMPSWEWK